MVEQANHPDAQDRRRPSELGLAQRSEVVRLDAALSRLAPRGAQHRSLVAVGGCVCEHGAAAERLVVRVSDDDEEPHRPNLQVEPGRLRLPRRQSQAHVRPGPGGRRRSQRSTRYRGGWPRRGAARRACARRSARRWSRPLTGRRVELHDQTRRGRPPARISLPRPADGSRSRARLRRTSTQVCRPVTSSSSLDKKVHRSLRIGLVDVPLQQRSSSRRRASLGSILRQRVQHRTRGSMRGATVRSPTRLDGLYPPGLDGGP